DRIDNRTGDDWSREGEELQREGEREDAPELPPFEESRELPSDRLGSGRERFEGFARLEDEGHAGERATELIECDAPPPARRIDETHVGARYPLEYEKVIELPMKDRATVEVNQILDLDLDPARAQTVVAGSGEDRVGVRAVAIDPDQI